MSTLSYFSKRGATNAQRWLRNALGRARRTVPTGGQHGIRARLMSGFIGVASLTLLASVVAFFSYNYIGQSLRRIETQSIPVMTRALIFAREAAEYSSLATTLQSATSKATLASSVAQLKSVHDEMSATLQALKIALPDATSLAKLQDSIDDVSRSVHASADAIEQRLAATERRLRLVDRALIAHRAIVEKLAPMLDDAAFDLTMGFQAFGDAHAQTDIASWANRA